MFNKQDNDIININLIINYKKRNKVAKKKEKDDHHQNMYGNLFLIILISKSK